MFKERRGRGRASAGPSVTSAGKNLKIQSPHQHNSPCFRLELSANSLNRHVRRVHEVTLFYYRIFDWFSNFRRNLLVLHVWLAKLDFHDQVSHFFSFLFTHFHFLFSPSTFGLTGLRYRTKALESREQLASKSFTAFPRFHIFMISKTDSLSLIASLIGSGAQHG